MLVEGWDDAAGMDEGWSSDGDEAVSFHDEDDDDFSIDIETDIEIESKRGVDRTID